MNQPSKDAFLELCDGAPLENYAQGDILMRKGEEGGYCLVIISGSVFIDLAETGNPNTRTVTRAAGDIIGELSMFQKTRSATVVAAAPCVCARIPHPALLQMVTSRPALTLALLAATMEKAREAGLGT